uniref:Putative secreted protein n=1 Tax=Ixodes ricinus TaxID=34613 RepID=A0A147BSK0_IXORI
MMMLLLLLLLLLLLRRLMGLLGTVLWCRHGPRWCQGGKQGVWRQEVGGRVATGLQQGADVLANILVCVDAFQAAEGRIQSALVHAGSLSSMARLIVPYSSLRSTDGCAVRHV